MSTVTRREIKQIETLAGYGLTQEQIGDCLGWSKRTSQRKLAEIPEAVAAYKEGRSKAISAVSKTVYHKAIEGNVACAFFYLKTQAGWRETERHEVTGADGGGTSSITGSGSSSKLMKIWS